MCKKLLSLVLVMVLMLSIGQIAHAENADATVTPLPSIGDIGGSEIQPLYDYTESRSTSLSISSGTATCTARLVGYEGTTTKIEVTMTLQKKSLFWWDHTSWSTTFNNYKGYLSQSTSVSSGTYRVKTEFKVYSGTKCETITVYSAEKTC